MQVLNYKYVLPTVHSPLLKCIEIANTDKSKLMHTWNWTHYKHLIESIKPKGRTAVLYLGGGAEHHSMSRDYPECRAPRGVMPVQSQMAFSASRVAKYYNAEYLNINANSCASSMYAIKEAEMLLNSGFDDVIIYGEEWLSKIELLLFKKMNIDLTCSDAFVILHLGKDSTKSSISDVEWKYYPDKNPFYVSKEGYLGVVGFHENIKAVKTHGTQTPNNTEAEYSAIREVYGNDIPLIEYKKEIGHTQGCSTAIELCMLLDREPTGKYLITVSGLGNFYGSCVLEKK